MPDRPRQTAGLTIPCVCGTIGRRYPHTNDLNYFQAPFTFFASLKSEEDKFSTIDSLVSITTTRSIPYTDYSYGFQFTTNQIEVEGEENAIVAQILYVADGSPARKSG